VILPSACMPPLHVDLSDNVLYQKLTIFDRWNPRSWTTTNLLGSERSMSDPQDADLFFADVESSMKAKVDHVYVSISQDADGCHRFVSLGAVAHNLKSGRGELRVYSEEDVKQMRAGAGAVMLFAKAIDDSRPSAGMDDSIEEVDDLCPKRSMWGQNYDVIPELSLGLTQRLILCDEATLMKKLPDEKIFEHLTLIVNCHENAVTPDKYKVGACSSGKHPAVICQAVHGWHGRDATGMNKKNDEIQTAIWEALQTGTVAVHCLAGIHRAACIVACHFLWRHYTLGHKEVPAKPAEIYRRLQASRPAVDPAYEHVLRAYEIHLKKNAGMKAYAKQ